MSRKKATNWFLNKINAILDNNKNVEMYKLYFASLSDKEFATLMGKLESGEVILPFYLSVLSKKKLTLKNLFIVADSLGLELFQKLWLVDEETGLKYLTYDTYLLARLPIRRQSQHLEKGKSVNKNSKFVDNLTGQGTGVSRVSRLSLPEIINLEAAGHVKGIEELMKVRGGDTEALRLAKRELVDNGEYSLKTIEELNSRPISTDTVRSILLAMHLDNNI